MTQERIIDWKRIAGSAAGIAVILLAAALAIAPQKHYGYSCGHDFAFHLVSWIETFNSWQRGLFYPHWAMSANYGAGEPRFVFYPPLSWMAGAAIRLRTGWYFVPIWLAYGMLAGTGLATRALARRLMDEAPATLAGCMAIFSPYALFTAYERSAFGELLGGLWIPLMILFALRDRRAASGWRPRTLDGSTVPLAVVFAGLWLSDIPLAVLASYLLAGVALAAALARRSWAPIARGTISVVLGLGLTCFYLVPAGSEQRWVNAGYLTHDPGYRVENNWLFSRHADPLLEMHDVVLLKASILAAVMLAAAFAGLAVAWLRGRLKAHRDWWLVLAAIPVAILFLQFPVSRFVWATLPKIGFVQFPWRWMVALEAPMSIFVVRAIWPERRWRQIAVVMLCMILFFGATYIADRVFLQGCDPEDSISGIQQAWNTGFEGTDEFEPPNTDNTLVPTGLPEACLVDDAETELAAPSTDTNPEYDPNAHICDATFATRWISSEHLKIEADAVHDGYLILRLRRYPAWNVMLNGKAAQTIDTREDGLMTVPVRQGPIDLEVRWVTTPDVMAGRWLSYTSVVLCMVLLYVEWWVFRRAVKLN